MEGQGFVITEIYIYLGGEFAIPDIPGSYHNPET
jgi:hypothetical protein